MRHKELRFRANLKVFLEEKEYQFSVRIRKTTFVFLSPLEGNKSCNLFNRIMIIVACNTDFSCNRNSSSLPRMFPNRLEQWHHLQYISCQLVLGHVTRAPTNTLSLVKNKGILRSAIKSRRGTRFFSHRLHIANILYVVSLKVH